MEESMNTDLKNTVKQKPLSLRCKHADLFDESPALDDFWFIQLDKMDGYTCLRPLETAVTTGEAPESSDDDDDDDGDDDDDDDDNDDGDDDENEEDEEKEDEDPEAEGPSKSKSTESACIPVVEDVTPPDDIREKAKLFMGAANDVNRSKDDVISTPLPGETLAVFYARSREFWAQKAHQSSDNRGKLLRRDGFAMAGERYAEYKPILEEVEKILAEAGLDEEEMKRVGGSGNVPLASGRNRR
ncbi:hypothetical protein FRC02_011164 [Tulasnella sp. 418]|nr:hypothetical protein FRC02_011164 [Tulasnella sp. 418]